MVDQGLRIRLLHQIEAEIRATTHLTGVDSLSERVKSAFLQVPREKFVPQAERFLAYHNTALPIGQGQTISQPYIVALMTELLCLEPEHLVLEIGTGSGYQAALLSLLVKQVYSIEIVPELAVAAAARLAQLGYDKVKVTAGDGYEGRSEEAPFDAVIVTAACQEVPQPLVDQLAEGGRMVLPLHRWTGDHLVLVEKLSGGDCRERDVLPVRFVPLTGGNRG
ncbi:MAG: protein-L-isoaspartate(D-aspartate) O-methyltransferase [Planctomycetota bacterium]|jgi:protein-L-isoaspartate(D-aspartate) O-methyltransferase